MRTNIKLIDIVFNMLNDIDIKKSDKILETQDKKNY